jgi:[acyl-carrier-protein] S-malonyltransferase
MAPVAAEFARAVGAVSIGVPDVPIVLNRTAEATTEPNEIRSALAGQLTHPVQWTATIQAMLAAGVVTFLEIGPGTVLTGITKRITRGRQEPVSAVSLSEPLAVATGSANA